MGHPCLPLDTFSFIFGLFKQAMQFYNKLMWKNVHLVSGAGIWRHNLLIMSLSSFNHKTRAPAPWPNCVRVLTALTLSQTEGHHHRRRRRRVRNRPFRAPAKTSPTSLDGATWPKAISTSGNKPRWPPVRLLFHRWAWSSATGNGNRASTRQTSSSTQVKSNFSTDKIILQVWNNRWVLGHFTSIFGPLVHLCLFWSTVASFRLFIRFFNYVSPLLQLNMKNNPTCMWHWHLYEIITSRWRVSSHYH